MVIAMASSPPAADDAPASEDATSPETCECRRHSRMTPFTPTSGMSMLDCQQHSNN